MGVQGQINILTLIIIFFCARHEMISLKKPHPLGSLEYHKSLFADWVNRPVRFDQICDHICQPTMNTSERQRSQTLSNTHHNLQCLIIRIIVNLKPDSKASCNYIYAHMIENATITKGLGSHGMFE